MKLAPSTKNWESRYGVLTSKALLLFADKQVLGRSLAVVVLTVGLLFSGHDACFGARSVAWRCDDSGARSRIRVSARVFSVCSVCELAADVSADNGLAGARRKEKAQQQQHAGEKGRGGQGAEAGLRGAL